MFDDIGEKIMALALLKSKISVGNIVTYGRYEQDNNSTNGKEAIRWRVLKREENKALLISELNLDCQPYNTSYESVTWETCTLRTWMNSTFQNAAFTEQERKSILATTLKNDENPEHKTDGGNTTQDKVFLLSIAEAETLFRSDADRVAKNTAYAKEKGAYDSNGADWWWLRSPGIYMELAAFVDTIGSVYRRGIYVNGDAYAVRPAFWIHLTSP